jgi:hypothetical protein
MTAPFEGQFTAKVASCEFGLNKKGAPEFSADFVITDGERSGVHVPYSGLFGEKAVRYTKQALLQLGWQGKDIATAVADVLKAAKAVPIEVQIASWKKDDGTVREWSTVRNVGRFKEPLKPADRGTLGDVNKWLADAGGDENNPTPF